MKRFSLFCFFCFLAFLFGFWFHHACTAFVLPSQQAASTFSNTVNELKTIRCELSALHSSVCELGLVIQQRGRE